MNKRYKAFRASWRLWLIFCFVVAGAQAQERAVSSGPEQAIRNFYQWYVQALVSDHNPLNQQPGEMKKYASARLLREIGRTAKGPDGLDGDYFLDAQDFDKGWAKNIHVSALMKKGDRSTADIELKGSEMGIRKLHVDLVQENRLWKIDRVKGRQ